MKTLKDWKEVELGEICEALTGFAFKSNLFNEERKGKPLIRIRDLSNGKSETYYSGEFENKYLVKKGDFLIGMDGEFKIFEWKSGDALLNQRVCKLILNKNLVFPKYIYYMISNKLKEIEDKTPFVTVKHISNKQILSIKFILPPLPVQKQIVSILEKSEKLKQKREEANKLTKEYLQSIFYEMFGNPNINTKKYEEIDFEYCLDKNFDSKDKIPQQDFLEQGKFPIIDQGENLIGGYTNDDNLIYSFNKPVIIFGDHTRILKLINFKFARGADGTHILNPIDKLNPHYFYHCLQLLDLPSAGYSRHLKFLKEKKISLPPLPLQQKFASIVEQVEKLKEKQKESKEKIDNLFNSLMQKAFNGELVK